MKKSIELLLLSLILVLSLAACRLSPVATPVPSTSAPVFQIVTATPEATATATVEVAKDDDTKDSSSNSNSNSSSGSSGSSNSGSSGWSGNNNNYVPPCYPRTDWRYIYTVVRGDTLSLIARRTASTVSTLVAGNCLSNANVISVGQKLYVPNEAIYQPQLTFSTISPTVARSYLLSSNPLFYVRWTVSDRPPNSNLRFDQLLPNGTVVNVELPRFNPYVASEGDGYVRLQNPGNVNQVVLLLTLFDMSSGATIRYRELIVQILDAPPTWTPTPIIPTPTPIAYTCYAVSNSSFTVYAGFQGTGVPAVGTVPAYTVVEVLTREFNGYYGVRYHWQGPQGIPMDIAWMEPSIPVYGNCNNLPDIWKYTGHGSGIDDGVTCVFVADTVVPIYVTPVIASTILHTTQNGEIYLFNAYGDSWISGDVGGYWIEVVYDLVTMQRGYVQNTGGHIQGLNCPPKQS